MQASAAVLTVGDLSGENGIGLITPAGTGPGIVSGTQVAGSTADPFAEIDQKPGPDDASALKSLIRNTQYAFSYDPAAGAWYARNAEKQIVFSCSKNGTAEFSDATASFRLSLSGIGRENSIEPVPDGEIHMDGRQLNITRPKFTEWYRNTETGVEQGLTLNSRPEGAGPVQVRFAISGNGTFAPGTGQALTVTDAAGNPLFSYTGLQATDAAGRELPASLVTNGRMLLWIVDDRDATCPVTIDPIVVPASAARGEFTGTGGDVFGTSVALSEDGSQCLIGAPGNSTSGAAYLFDEPPDGWAGTTPSDAIAVFTGGASGDFFGTSVALSQDGSRILAGAYSNSTAGSGAGAAYLFAEPTGGWTGSTSASDATAAFTGGAGGDQFGTSVALSRDGSRVLIGADQNATAGSGAGAAYLFAEPTGGWTGSTSASDATAAFTGGAGGDLFGYSVALSEDGSRALIGADQNATAGSDAGAAYLFAEPTGGWTGSTSASNANAAFIGGAGDDQFGTSVALSEDGSRALIGADQNATAGSDAGAAYLFAEPTGGWTGSTSASNATAAFTGGASGDLFGYSVALSEDGSRALIGANYNSTSGAAYLFTEPTRGWTGSTSASDATAAFTGGAAGDDFGWSVALSQDGSRVLVGAEQVTAGSFAGAAYLFVPPYAMFSAGGTTRGQTGAFVDGLTLRPSLSLTTCDLYLGTTETAVSGTPVKTGIASLTAASATTINGIDLTGKIPGTYYLIACENGTTMVLASTTSAAFTVTAIPATNDGSDTSGESSRDTSFVVTSPGTGPGSTMTFAVSEPLNAGGIDYPYAIITVTLVPKETLGSTDLIVTDAGSMANVPDGRTFAGTVTISPVAVNPSGISSGTITFAVSSRWLSAHGMTPSDIVLMRYHDDVWEELPTTYQSEAGGACSFVATTPGFSYFAIANRVSTASVNTTATPGPTGTATFSAAPAAPVMAAATRTTAPITTETTAVPVGTAGPFGIPGIAMLLTGIGGIVVLAVGVVLVRRWWIRRQNPALFKKYD